MKNAIGINLLSHPYQIKKKKKKKRKKKEKKKNPITNGDKKNQTNE